MAGIVEPGMGYLFIFVISVACSYLFSLILIPRLQRFGFVGKDMHKQGKPQVAEMGGLSIVIGFSAGVLLAIMLNTFNGLTFNIVFILAGLLTVHTLAFIGIIDDILDVPQWAKALIPLISAVPLIAVEAAGSTEMLIPFIGLVDFGIIYIILLIPVGIAVSSNLTNMLAGFNGMEAGMGAIIFASMSVVAWFQGQTEMLVLYLPMLGGLLGFLPKNWFPAKVFPGDVGTLPIGAVFATGVIVGNLESAGAMILILFIADFLLKLRNRFPKTFAKVEGNKLYSPAKPRGLVDVVLKITKGMEEKKLVMTMMGLQAIIGIIVILLFIQL